jgi:hypothetical protein
MTISGVARLAAALLVLATSQASCSSENGRGIVRGRLVVPACTVDKAGDPVPIYNEAEAVMAHANNPDCRDPVTGEVMPFCGEWNHFLGEPFDSTSAFFPANQLNIRMQSTSGGWEFADVLFFWVYNSWEVARCLRGRMNADGTPDWNTNACDWSSGEGRMLIGTEGDGIEGELVTSHFVLQNSCPSAQLSASALGACAGGTCPEVAKCPGRGSWIQFSEFGDKSYLTDRSKPLDDGFKVNKDEPIAATAFHVELCDQDTIDRAAQRLVPVSKPQVTGFLDGSFSFNLQPNFR